MPTYSFPTNIAVGDLGQTSWANTVGSALNELGPLVDTKADDDEVVKLSGNQTVDGTKTFSAAPSVPDNSFSIAKTNGLQTALNAKAPLASPTFTGTVSGITKAMVGLTNVDNTSDANKPVSTATQTALNGKANTSHTHTASQVTDFDTGVDNRIAASTSVVRTTTDQTISGIKTFSSAPVVPESSFLISTISGLQAELSALNAQLANKPEIFNHGSNADAIRPNVLCPIMWVGTVYPNNMLPLDFYLSPEAPDTDTFVGAFDNFATPHRAISLRRLRNEYTGPLIRVRRSSDSVEQDISYTSTGDLDTAALTAFTGANHGYVVRWYDQSSNGRDFEQTVAGAQPRIVNAGVVDTLNGKPAVRFDGTDDYMGSALAGLYAAGAATVAGVFSGSAVANSCVFSEHATTGTNSIYRAVRSSTAAWNTQATNSAGTAMWAQTISGDTTFDGNAHQVFWRDTGAVIDSWRDNATKHVALTATRSGTMSIDRTSIGAHGATSPSNFMNGTIQEMVAWGSDETTDRTAIQTAQKDYWGTP